MIYFSSEASDEKQSPKSSRFLALSKQAPKESESGSGRDGRHLRMRIGRSIFQMFSIDSKDFAASMQPPSVSNAAEPDVRTRSFSSVSGSSKSSRTQISVYFMPLIVLSQDHSKRRPWESLMRAYSSASRSSLAHPSYKISSECRTSSRSSSSSSDSATVRFLRVCIWRSSRSRGWTVKPYPVGVEWCRELRPDYQTVQ